MSKKWYVVHTYSGHENKVKTNLEKAIHAAAVEEHFGQILVATEDYAEMKDGKRKISKRKTFPSYVMIEMELNNDTRHLVQNVPGVTRFIGSGQSAIAFCPEPMNRVTPGTFCTTWRVSLFSSISIITYDGNVFRLEIFRFPSFISAKSSVATRIWPK